MRPHGAKRLFWCVLVPLLVAGCGGQQSADVSSVVPLDMAITDSELVVLGKLESVRGAGKLSDINVVLIKGSLIVDELLLGQNNDEGVLSVLCPYRPDDGDIPPRDGEQAIFFLYKTSDGRATASKVLASSPKTLVRIRTKIDELGAMRRKLESAGDTTKQGAEITIDNEGN